MSLFKGFGIGFINCFKAFSIVFERGLWHYIFYPILLWLIIFFTSIYGFMSLANYLTDLIKPYFDFGSSDISWLAFVKPKLSGVFEFIISLLLKFVFWFTGSIFSKYLMLILLSPLFSLLSESVEEKMTGKKFPFSFIQLIKDIGRGTLISIRNMFMELFLSFGLWLITFFFPPLFFITVPLSLIIGWYFTGFSLFDYNCERHRMSVGKSIRFMKTNRGYAIGTGFVYAFFMILPTFAGDLIGLMFGPILTVVGSTLSFLQIQKESTDLS